MKYIFALLVFISFKNISIAQICIKPKAGVNFSNLHRPYRQDFQDNQVLKLGFHAGAALEIPLRNRFSLQAELLYQQKGLKDTSLIPIMLSPDQYYKGYGYKFHYLEVPLLLRHSFPNDLVLGIGPSLSYLMYTDFFLGGRRRNLMTTTFSPFDWGLNGDVSYSVKYVEIGLRYSHGLSTVHKHSKEQNPEIEILVDEAMGQNRNFQFYLSYRFKR